MGEYADMAIDDALHWQVEELANPDEWDGQDFWFPRRRFTKQAKTCRSCGATNLYWYEHESEWRLHEFNLEKDEFVPHACKLKAAFKRGPR